MVGYIFISFLVLTSCRWPRLCWLIVVSVGYRFCFCCLFSCQSMFVMLYSVIIIYFLTVQHSVHSCCKVCYINKDWLIDWRELLFLTNSMKLGYSNMFLVSRFMGQIQLTAFISKRPTWPKMFVFLYFIILSLLSCISLFFVFLYFIILSLLSCISLFLSFIVAVSNTWVHESRFLPLSFFSRNMPGWEKLESALSEFPTREN